MKILSKLLIALPIVIVSTFSLAATPTPVDAKFSTGEVRKVDLTQGKLTIKHGPIDNLGMPAMTMVFNAGKADLLKTLKPGDNIKFRAEAAGGTLVVTEIQAAN
jgi:Cu(I)/Ag(I) efflux system protein CusF